MLPTAQTPVAAPSTRRTFIGSTTFTVTGMTCAHCQRAVTDEITGVDGVESVTVDLATGTVTVTVCRPVDRAEIAAAVDEAGYVLVP
jgi:copper chaperone CopZ